MNEINIEQSMVDRREERVVQNGPGTELAAQVTERQNLKDSDESLKFYRRKGVSAIKGFDHTNMYQDGFDPLSRDDHTMLIPNHYAKPNERTMFGIDPATGQKVDSLPHEPSMWGSIPRIVVGAARDTAVGMASAMEDAYGDNAPIGMSGVKVRVASALAQSEEPAWLNESAGWGEDITRDIAQFGMGYAGATKVLGSMGVKSFISKDILGSIAAGQTFDPAEGNIGTLLADFDMLPDSMRFLDSKMTTEEEGRFQGRLAMALEEVGIGAGIVAVRAANQIRKGMKARYKETGNIMLRTGVKEYYEATASVTHPAMGVRGDEIIHADPAEAALHKIASGWQMTGGNVGNYLALTADAGIDEKLAKKAWNSASREKLGRVEGFIDPPITPAQQQAGN